MFIIMIFLLLYFHSVFLQRRCAKAARPATFEQ